MGAKVEIKIKKNICQGYPYKKKTKGKCFSTGISSGELLSGYGGIVRK